MKRFLLNTFALIALSLAFVSCDDDSSSTEIIDSAIPTGSFTASRSGSFTAQNGTPTAGMVAIGSDTDGENFLQFGSDFTTMLATGTVSVYFSTSDTFTPDPANGNPDLMLVGAISQNGESFIKLNGAVNSNFTHVILWCGSANIPFGYAMLQ